MILFFYGNKKLFYYRMILIFIGNIKMFYNKMKIHIKTYYKLFKLLIRFVHSIVLYEINNRKYIIEDRNL